MTTINDIHTLHKYFIWANGMREHFYEVGPTAVNDPERDRFGPAALKADMYMSFWYGELYVVIEGWRALGLSDSTVDELLSSPNVELLRRYRNGAFHFQNDYFDRRFLDFITQPDTPTWVRALNAALGTFFLRKFKEHRENGVGTPSSAPANILAASRKAGPSSLVNDLPTLDEFLEAGEEAERLRLEFGGKSHAGKNLDSE